MATERAKKMAEMQRKKFEWMKNNPELLAQLLNSNGNMITRRAIAAKVVEAVGYRSTISFDHVMFGIMGAQRKLKKLAQREK